MRYIDTTELLKKRNRWGNRKELWKNKTLQTDFREFFHDKCWYSEVRLSGHDAPIDHFRPKAEVRPYGDYNFNLPLRHSGYFWLKNTPGNYRTCCTYSNRRTDGGGKSCYFPLADESEYLTELGTEQELALLIDPCIEEDVKLLSFVGNQVASASNNPDDVTRVKISINIYNLDNSFIKADRRRIWDEVEKTLIGYQAGEISKNYCLRCLRDLTSRQSVFSACAIACVNSLAPDDIKAELDLHL